MIKKLFLSIIIGTVLISCANNPIRSYKNDSDKTLNNIANGVIESAVYGKSNNPDLIYYMENGLYQRMLSQYTVSNQQMTKAQDAIDIWVNSWKNTTSGRITTSATQMLINDNATDYQPAGYEKTALAAYHALNHIDIDNWQNARVEIKKMYQTEQAIENYNQALYLKTQADSTNLQNNPHGNIIYQQIIQKYDFSDINSPKVLSLKNSYQSAFSHYLAGFVFEALGEKSLSRPGYVKAGQLNPTNRLTMKSIDNLDNNNTQRKGYTNLLIIEEVGHAPQYKSKQIPIVFGYNSTGSGQTCVNDINLFFPELIPDRQGSEIYNYTMDGKLQNQELYTDYDLMSARYLHDQMPHLIARNIAAAIRNISASQASCSGAGGNLGTVLSIATTIGGILLDRADERTWVLLPSKVYLSRAQLPYGKHTLQLNVNGREYTKEISLDSPYQIFDMRILEDKVFFMDEQE